MITTTSSRRVHRLFTLLALAILAAAIIAACLLRGPWYDEFYTQYVTRPDVPWWTAMRDSWLVDNHPPLYYALSRATDSLGPISTHRLLNLGLGVALLACATAIVRDVPRLLPAACAVAIGLVGNSYAVHSGSELRSYFLSLCLGILLPLCLTAIRLTGSAGTPVRQAAWWITALLAFNTHIVTSLTAAALIAPFLLAALTRRDWREARAIALPPLAGGLVFAAITSVQFPLWMDNTRVFWIKPGFSTARWSIELGILRTIEANPLLLLAALAGSALLLIDVALRRRPSGELGALALLAAGLILTAVGLTALHLLHPMLVEKYLTAMFGAVLFGAGLATGHLLQIASPRQAAIGLALILAYSCYTMVHNVRTAAHIPSWMMTGEPIAALVKACPTTVVHPGYRWNRDVMNMKPADNAQVYPFAYHYVADRLHFAVEPAGSTAISQTCPTVFWTEHQTKKPVSAPDILRHIRDMGFPIRHIVIHRVGSGWYAVADPLPAN
ncbi:hypothetical protein [Novosphingobium sp. 9]|uniref:hypothetical protein n=1 Tax=Novosphingobium sp. 9 TaxID=2025349 RepID=UPI0021B5BED1|nr:hypothetical protein [Novosphingobium sp. 9]